LKTRVRRHRNLLLSIILLFAGCEAEVIQPPSFSPLPLEDFEGAVREHLEKAILLRQKAASEDDLEKQMDEYAAAGNIFQAYGLLPHAIETYRLALSRGFENHRVSYLLALTLKDNGDLEEAKELLISLLSQKPQHLTSLIALAEIEYSLGETHACESLAKTILRNHPLSVPALALLGQSRLANGDAEEAVLLLSQALEMSPGASALRYPLGLALRESGDLTAAEAQMAMRGSAFPKAKDPWMAEILALRKGGRVHLNEGTLLFSEGLYSRAEAAFIKALQFDPESPTAHLNLGSARVKLGRLSEARSSLNEAIRLDPDMALAWFDLGVVEAQDGNDRLAIKCYDRAISIDKGQTEARFNRANAYRRLGEFDKALADLQIVIEEVPGNDLAWLAGAVSLVRIDLAKEARDWVQRALLTHPDNPRLLGFHARLTACDKKSSAETLKKQMEVMSRVTSRQPDLELLEAKAMLHAAMGDFEEAKHLQNALIRAAIEAGQPQLSSRLKPHLDAYSRGELPFDPWPELESADEP